jgi:hypothetical protein
MNGTGQTPPIARLPTVSDRFWGGLGHPKSG